MKNTWSIGLKDKSILTPGCAWPLQWLGQACSLLCASFSQELCATVGQFRRISGNFLLSHSDGHVLKCSFLICSIPPSNETQALHEWMRQAFVFFNLPEVEVHTLTLYNTLSASLCDVFKILCIPAEATPVALSQQLWEEPRAQVRWMQRERQWRPWVEVNQPRWV